MTNIKRADFTEAQELAAFKLHRAGTLRKGWVEDLEKAKEQIASKDYISSFDLENLTSAVAVSEVVRFLTSIDKAVRELAVLADNGMVTEIKDWDKFLELVNTIESVSHDSYLSYWLPNSTSQLQVELKLREHMGWQNLYNVASGRRAY